MSRKEKLLKFLEKQLELNEKDFNVIFCIERVNREPTFKSLIHDELNKWKMQKFSNYKYDELIKFLYDYDKELVITQEAKEKYKIEKSIDFIINQCRVFVYKRKYGHDKCEINGYYVDRDIEKIENF